MAHLHLLKLIVLIVCLALPSLAPDLIGNVQFDRMPFEMRTAFKHYLESHQPFRIDYAKHAQQPEDWVRGHIYWPAYSQNVYLGAGFVRNPRLSPFSERPQWWFLYMDDDTKLLLERIESLLNRVRPGHVDRTWFRDALARALNPRHRPHQSMPHILRYVLDPLLLHSAHADPAEVYAIREEIKRLVDSKWAPGSYENWF